MRPFYIAWRGMIVLCFLSIALSGCFGTSQPSRFYTLSSLKGAEPIQHATSTGHETIVAIGPLAIPDYLDRPEIVTRAGQNEMRVNEFQRWAGALEGNLLRIIVEDLSVMLPADRFSVIRWIPAAQRDLPIAYRVMVDVMRFDAAPGGTVFLEADWMVYDKEKAIALTRKSSISGRVSGTEFTDLISAMSKAIEDLSREIAEGVTALEQKAPGK
jgi:uncharacterized lipoprotein YmbA